MSALSALLLVAAQGPDEERLLAPLVQVRGGMWLSGGFDFEAVRADGLRRVEGRGLYSGGVELGGVALDRYLAFGTFEVSEAGDVVAEAAGASLGYRMKVEDLAINLPPAQVTVYGGLLWGRFDVRKEDFGDFDDGWGGRAGLALSWPVVEGLVVNAVLEYRLLTFDYQEPVTGGDREAGGSSVWAGLGLELRF